MAKSYVKYETPKDIAVKALETLTIANDTGRVRKGANETTKSIESGMARLILIACDVEPEEVVMHLPEICKEKEIAFVYIPTKKEIGDACSIPVSCASVSIEKAGNASETLNDICDKVMPLCGIVPTKSKVEHKEHDAKKEDKKKSKPKKGEDKKE